MYILCFPLQWAALIGDFNNWNPNADVMTRVYPLQYISKWFCCHFCLRALCSLHSIVFATHFKVSSKCLVFLFLFTFSITPLLIELFWHVIPFSNLHVTRESLQENMDFVRFQSDSFLTCF